MNQEIWTGISSVNWEQVLKKPINLKSHYKIIPSEGYLAWEYNPLRNYRLNQNMYEKDGKYYTKKDLGITYEEETSYLQNLDTCKQNQILLNQLQSSPESDASKITELQNSIKDLESKIEEFESNLEHYTLHEAGELVDFITDELSFNLSHPVNILPQYSYDGSVNLILNDGLNIPRLINSRFTATGKNTYKIVDRKGDNDTNIYDQGEQFDVDTSLFKNVNKIPNLEYLGTISGNMKIGNYHFYFKYADADGNESDWVAESGLVSLFIGNNPQSVDTGIRDENSIKGVYFRLSNIDIGYSYVKVYYTRYSADIDSNLIVSAKQIDKNFIVNNSGTCSIIITGDENEIEVTLEEINSSFDVIQNAQTQCTAANRLFMANIHKSKIEYDMLAKLSLCFCPYKTEEPYPLINGGMDEKYFISSASDGYYDNQFIYNKTGYWPEELYRLGVVYILKDGSLSPVFNIRGATNITYNTEYKITQDFSKGKTLEDALSEINYSEENYIIANGKANNENAKGVIQLSANVTPFAILGINIKASHLVIKELKKYCKGFFFVRQKRMPLTLCQGIVIGLDKESRTPTIPTLGGVVSTVNANNSYIETDLADINFVSEGFLSRYRYKLTPKASGFFKKLVTAIGAVVVLAAAAVATVCTLGAASPVLVGAGIATTALITTSGIVSAMAITGIVAASAIVASAITIGAQEIALHARQKRNKGAAARIKGRHESIPKGFKREELEDSRKLNNDIEERYIIKEGSKNNPDAIVVPDYQVNQPYYNQLFVGSDYSVKLSPEQPITSFVTDGYFESYDRHFYTPGYQVFSDKRTYHVKLVGVPDGSPVKMINDDKYCARAGYPEEAHKYEFIGEEYKDTRNKIDNSDIVRGNFGSFVGMANYSGHACDQINIMIPGYKENDLYNYIQLRAKDTSAFYAISDRIDINTLNVPKNTTLEEAQEENNDDFSGIYYRGDSYICQYTHRIVRNFNDPSAPYNDVIVDSNCWRAGYNPDAPESYSKINLGDVNAIQLGLWLTFWVRSSYNLNVRTIDKSNVDEHLMCGNYRSFYPNYSQLALGSQKIPDSSQYNKGFTKSVSEKYYFEVPDVPYIKQEFQNRIVFSDIHINDAYKNGFRVLRTTNHKDYPMTYGSITKLIELKNSLLVIFEHGIGLVAIDNSAQHPSQILSDLNIISDTYGSQWADSIIKTPSGVYGVDTVARKIWRVKEGQIELISDMRVQEFLNQNISLSERELTPIIGVRNVKTVYNAFKHDIMFTFYDNLYGTSEKCWNLCWNEILQVFTTFYSWIPGELQNIDNIPFSFDRNTLKAIGKLGVSNHDNSFSDGVTLTNNILYVTKSDTQQYSFKVNKYIPEFTYIDEQGLQKDFDFKEYTIDDPDFVGFLYLDNRVLPDLKTSYTISYKLLRDRQGNHDLFEIREKVLTVEPVNTLHDKNVNSIKVYYLALKQNVKGLLSDLYYRNQAGHSYPDYETNKTKSTKDNICIEYPIFKNISGKRLTLPEKEQINPDKLIRYLNIKASINIITKDTTPTATEAYYKQFTEGDNMISAGYYESTIAITTDFNLTQLSTDFWRHGQAGIFDITDKIYPTYWYGKQHPFEFECVVVDDPSVHKIFTNLELISNKVKPESFHYEVIGDVYDFSEDKPTMYFRQEALKALYQYNGYNIEYNPNFLEIEPKQHNKSADLPKYYSRWDTINEVYDSYTRFSAPKGFSYDHLAGAEIVYYPTRNEFRIWNHVEAIDVDSLSQDIATSVIKANCRYLEDKWLVSINPIIVTYKNEFNKIAAAQNNESMFAKNEDGTYRHSTWVYKYGDSDKKILLPPINIGGTKLEEKLNTSIRFPDPDKEEGEDNSLYKLYDLNAWNQGDWKPIDPTKNKDRRETDVRGKFMKVRIRYSGEELAIIDFLNTIYQISFA